MAETTLPALVVDEDRLAVGRRDREVSVRTRVCDLVAVGVLLGKQHSAHLVEREYGPVLKRECPVVAADDRGIQDQCGEVAV
ncbi:MAG: hypothetical protein U1E22_03655, partial [Coriobacteriia bacterium]|nr:hypothetical protein [Coriobacteriia bacterium]